MNFLAISPMISGVVLQQPPMISAPHYAIHQRNLQMMQGHHTKS